MRPPVPRKRLRQCVLQGRRLETELRARSVENVTRRALWVRAVWACVGRQLGERDRMEPGRDGDSPCDALDEVAEAHALKRDVVRLASRVLAEVARQGAREADVLDPRQSRLPFRG